MEDKFLVAYPDQRGCSKSLACSDTARLNEEQHIHDLDIVIEDEQHHKYLFYKGKLTLFFRYQTELTLLQNMVYFDQNGYYDPAGIRWDGFLTDKRFGNRLPLDYIVDQQNQGIIP